MDKLPSFSGGNMPGGPSVEGPGNNGASGQAGAEEKRRQEEEMKNSILARILEQDARERLGRVAIVKPEKAQAVESMLINMAKSGRLQGKVKEDDLIQLLERISDNEQNKTKIVFNRRRFDEDSEEEEYDF